MAKRFSTLGGHVSLDFANTVEWRGSDTPEEQIHNLSDFAVFCHDSGIISRSEIRLLMDVEDRNNEAKSSISLNQIKNTRETIYQIMLALSKGQRPPSEQIDVLNREVSKLSKHTEIEWHGNHFQWRRPTETPSLKSIHNEIIWRTANFLADTDYSRIKQCADDRGCGWMFVDKSKNNSRKWCSPALCGNRAKVRDHYYRHNA